MRANELERFGIKKWSRGTGKLAGCSACGVGLGTPDKEV